MTREIQMRNSNSLALLGIAVLTAALAACNPRDGAGATAPAAPTAPAAAAAGAAPPAVARPMGFTGGAASPDALIADLLAALAKKDRDQMDLLRVSRDEYNLIIVPGTVERGKPPRQITDQTRDFFWSLLDTRSDQFGDLLMGRYGGQTYRIDAVRFSEAPQEYDWYKAIGELRLDATNEQGESVEIKSGWIAEVDGKYKFISFQWDD
jgi:hypothetical protein